MRIIDILISTIILFAFISFIALTISEFQVYQPEIGKNTTFQDYSYFANETITPMEQSIYSYANTTYGGSDLLLQLQVAFGLGTYIMFGMLKTIVFSIIMLPSLLISLFAELILKTENSFLIQIFGILGGTILIIITLYILGLIVKVFTQRGDV